MNFYKKILLFLSISPLFAAPKRKALELNVPTTNQTFSFKSYQYASFNDSDSHSIPQLSRFYCVSCPYSTNNWAEYNHHLTIHPNQTTYNQCHYCKQTFATKTDLELHNLTHFETKSYKCLHQNCFFSTNEKRCFDKHKQIHLEQNIQQCGINGCQFESTPPALQRHKKLVHSRNSPLTIQQHHLSTSLPDLRERELSIQKPVSSSCPQLTTESPKLKTPELSIQNPMSPSSPQLTTAHPSSVATPIVSESFDFQSSFENPLYDTPSPEPTFFEDSLDNQSEYIHSGQSSTNIHQEELPISFGDYLEE